MTDNSFFDNVYWVASRGLTDDARMLRNRWLHEPFRSLSLALREAVAVGQEELALRDFETIKVETKEGELELTDLRGINFNRLHIGAVNLSYCCFDHATFMGTVLNETHIQYSTFANAHFEGSSWLKVQGSPIYAPGAKFHSAELRDAFLMHSILSSCDFSYASLHGVSLSSTDLTQALLHQTLIVEECDAWAAHLTEGNDTKAWLTLNNVKGRVTFHPLESPEQPALVVLADSRDNENVPTIKLRQLLREQQGGVGLPLAGMYTAFDSSIIMHAGAIPPVGQVTIVRPDLEHSASEKLKRIMAIIQGAGPTGPAVTAEVTSGIYTDPDKKFKRRRSKPFKPAGG